MKTIDDFEDLKAKTVPGPAAGPVEHAGPGLAAAEGRRLPSSGSAIWHLPDGPFTYAEFTFSPGDISRNVAPAALQTGTAQLAAGLGRSRPCRES